MKKVMARFQQTVFSLLAVLVISAVIVQPARGQKATVDSPKAASPAKAALAVVDGSPIYEDELMPVMGGQWQQLMNQEYQVKSHALEVMVNSRLIAAEAKKKGVEMLDFVNTEIDSKVPEPTEEDAKSAYQESSEKNNHSYEELAPQIKQSLKEMKISEARKLYVDELRRKSKISILLHPPKYSVSIDLGRVRGPGDAPVTIVEFSDFECPYRLRAYEILKSVLPKFEGKIKFAYRDFPLRSIHSQAQSAAEASRCAGEQDKFWEFHDSVFNAPGKLANPDLLERAKNLKLDLDSFSTCLSSRKYLSAVENDLQEGVQLGIQGTPAFYINGTMLSGAQPAEVFESTIRAELDAAQPKSK